MNQAMEDAPPKSAPWGRLLFTGALPLLCWAAQHIVLPGIDTDKLRTLLDQAGSPSGSSHLSIVALGLSPVVTGFLLTELGAALVPRWRSLRRGDLAGREVLRRSALGIALLCALVQGFFVARFLSGASQAAAERGGYPDLIASGAFGWFVPLTTLTLAAGTYALLALGRAIERYALGGGFSVLTLILLVPTCVEWMTAPGTQAVWQEDTAIELALGGGLALGVLMVVMLALLRPLGGSRGVPVRLPSCGLVPLSLAITVMELPSRLAAWLGWPVPDWLTVVAPGTAGYWVAYAALAAGLGVLLSRLFSGPEWGHRADSRALRGATLWSLVVLLVVAAGNHATARLLGAGLDLVLLAAVPAVMLDLAAEWRMRRTHGALALVWTCSHLPAASAVTAQLAAAGIPVVIRSLHHRSLWHFFAPYFEMDVLVPVGLAQRAQELLSGPAGESALSPDPVAAARRGTWLVWTLAGLSLVLAGLFAAQHRPSPGPTVQLVYKAAPESASREPEVGAPPSDPSLLQGLSEDVQVIRSRLDHLGIRGAMVRAAGNQILVGLPTLPAAEHARVRGLLARRAQLTFRLVDDGSAYMRQLSQYATDSAARFPGLEVGQDAWLGRERGEQHTDSYLKASDPAVLRTFLSALPAELAPPAGRSLQIERLAHNEDSPAPTYRTHLLRPEVLLTDRDITEADMSWDTQTGRPELTLTFSNAAAVRLEELTAANVGRRLAISLDNGVNSAPVIEGRIAGGRARISLGGFDSPEKLRQEAKDLLAVLRVGSLPIPLQLEREGPMAGPAPAPTL